MTEEHGDGGWVNLNHVFRVIKNVGKGGCQFLWGSEKGDGGISQIYKYQWEGTEGEAKEIGRVTGGTGVAEGVIGYDYQSGVCYCVGNVAAGGRWGERHVIASKDGKDDVVSGDWGGWNVAAMDGKCRYAVCKSSGVGEVQRARVFKKDDNTGTWEVVKEIGRGLGGEDLVSPEMGSFRNREGTELFYSLYKPDESVHGKGPHPLVVSVYGGPHVQRVNSSWSQNADMRAQMLRSMGFAVVKCDNRGGARRGRDFELEIKGDMGNKEVDDQVDCVKHVTGVLKVGDKNRVGVVGWSYGGYMSAMCLAKVRFDPRHYEWRNLRMLVLPYKTHLLRNRRNNSLPSSQPFSRFSSLIAGTRRLPRRHQRGTCDNLDGVRHALHGEVHGTAVGER